MNEKELEQLLRKQADLVAKESGERAERYLGALKEDFDHKLEAVFEYVKDIPAIKATQDLMFDQIGVMAEDITIIKETIKDQEQKISILEQK